MSEARTEVEVASPGAAFLANRHSLLAYTLLLVQDAAAADDIFQEVWLRLEAATRRGEHIESQAKWCRGVARNLALHYWREKRGRKLVFDSRFLDRVEVAFQEREADQEVARARQRALAACVRSLPEKSKKLLSLRYRQNLSATSAAERLHTTATGVLKALSRLRAALAECVERRLAAESDA